jgi:hypothetical protein
VRVAEHLDLDVARLLDELLDEHAVVAEAARASLRHALKPSRPPSFQAIRMPLPPPPADALIITG